MLYCNDQNSTEATVLHEVTWMISRITNSMTGNEEQDVSKNSKIHDLVCLRPLLEILMKVSIVAL